MGEGWGCFTATGNYIPGMWGSFQFLISLSTKLPLSGPVPRKPWPRLVGVMDYNVTFITGTAHISKSEAHSRTQSLTANAFPNLRDHIYLIYLDSLRLNIFRAGNVSGFMKCQDIAVQTSQAWPWAKSWALGFSSIISGQHLCSSEKTSQSQSFLWSEPGKDIHLKGTKLCPCDPCAPMFMAAASFCALVNFAHLLKFLKFSKVSKKWQNYHNVTQY